MSRLEGLIEKFKVTRQTTLNIVAPLELEDYSLQPSIEVSPPKWHLGHTTWFFENFILSNYHKAYQLFDKEFNYVFNSYYESQGDRILRDKRGTLSRPSLDKVLKYRNEVNSQILNFFSNSSLIKDEAIYFLELGINHEQQHQELLLTDIKYILATNPLKPIYNAALKNRDSAKVPLKWLNIEGGIHYIGHQGTDFSFDNELAYHKKYIDSFQCTNRCINNKEYLEFINDGAYHKADLWLAEGWDWIKENKVECPLYWIKVDGKWMNYKLNGFEEVNELDPICHLSFYEAEAFARWSGARLLTEFEWEIAALKYGDLNRSENFLDLKSVQPYQEKLENSFYGTVWEWTNSAYLPYPKYKQAEGALGEYNGKFMINQMVLRGGSCATPKSHFRTSYRNFFHPNYRWQFSGFRLAKDS